MRTAPEPAVRAVPERTTARHPRHAVIPEEAGVTIRAAMSSPRLRSMWDPAREAPHPTAAAVLRIIAAAVRLTGAAASLTGAAVHLPAARLLMAVPLTDGAVRRLPMEGVLPTAGAEEVTAEEVTVEAAEAEAAGKTFKLNRL